MKLIIIRGNFKEGLSAVEKSTKDNQNLPILKNVLIEAADDGIKLTATNLEIATSYYVSGKTIEKGSITTPISVLSNIINNLTAERLNIERKTGSLYVKTDNYEATLQGMPAEDFPLIPKMKNTESFLEIAGAILKDAFAQVLTSTQFSELHPQLNSIFFHFSFDELKLVGTDSFRLSEKTIPKTQFSSNEKQEFSVLIPLKTCQELLRTVKDDDVVRICHEEGQIFFKTTKLELISRLTEGTFPDYNAIIPKKFDAEVVVNREECINALKLVGILGSRANEVVVRLAEGKKALEILSADQGLGENKYFLPAKIRGNAKEASFNWRYLLDGLKAVTTEDVFWGMHNDDKPAMIRSAHEASYFYILKPVLKI